MKKIEFNRTVFRDGVLEFEQGKQYDVTEVTTREVRRGHAVEVDVKAEKVEAVKDAVAKKPKGKGGK